MLEAGPFAFWEVKQPMEDDLRCESVTCLEYPTQIIEQLYREGRIRTLCSSNHDHGGITRALRPVSAYCIDHRDQWLWLAEIDLCTVRIEQPMMRAAAATKPPARIKPSAIICSSKLFPRVRGDSSSVAMVW
jgi:hypothetical protein